MTNQVFLNAPIFYTEKLRLPRKRNFQPVLICNWRLTELPPLSRSDLSPFVTDGSIESRIADFALIEERPVRRARKRDGDPFTTATLQSYKDWTAEEVVQTILSEPDHPFAPLLLGENAHLPIYPFDDAPLHPSEETKAWLEQKIEPWLKQFLSVDGEIFVPSYPPTLALSLDRDRQTLNVSIHCPPRPSPAIRLPTLHLPLATSMSLVEAIAAILQVELCQEVPTPQTAAHELPDQWVTTTLAHLYRYLVRKGVPDWPMPFDELSRAYERAVLADMSPTPLDWLGGFLEQPSKNFGHLQIYIEGLQQLIKARYEALCEEPPGSSDELSDIVL